MSRPAKRPARQVLPCKRPCRAAAVARAMGHIKCGHQAVLSEGAGIGVTLNHKLATGCRADWLGGSNDMPNNISWVVVAFAIIGSIGGVSAQETGRKVIATPAGMPLSCRRLVR